MPAPAAQGSVVVSIPRTVSGVWYEVDLTGFITGDGTYSLRVTSPSADGSDYVSSEATGGLAPVLTLGLAP